MAEIWHIATVMDGQSEFFTAVTKSQDGGTYSYEG